LTGGNVGKRKAGEPLVRAIQNSVVTAFRFFLDLQNQTVVEGGNSLVLMPDEDPVPDTGYSCGWPGTSRPEAGRERCSTEE
jgi:hypothetical protein